MSTLYQGLVLALGMVIAMAPACAEPPVTLTNSLGMELVRIPPGTFMMGSDPLFDSDASKDELPWHRVTISKPFCLGKYEVTQGQWVAVMGKNPADNFRGRTMPVDQISWDDAQEFIRKLNAQEGTTDYRLPTEAEWEYAARAGTDTIRYWGDSEDDKGEYAWHGGNARGRPHPVGLLQPNPWGLYDILGNSSEWTEDGYANDYYARSPTSDPPGPGDSNFRVLRGGSWRDDVNHVRTSNRLYYSQGAVATTSLVCASHGTVPEVLVGGPRLPLESRSARLSPSRWIQDWSDANSGSQALPNSAG